MGQSDTSFLQASVHPCVHLCIHPPINPPVHTPPFIPLCPHPSTHPSVCSSIHDSIHPHLHPFIPASIRPHICSSPHLHLQPRAISTLPSPQPRMGDARCCPGSSRRAARKRGAAGMVGGRQMGVRGHCVTSGFFQDGEHWHQQRSSLSGLLGPCYLPLFPAWELSQPSPGTHGCLHEQLPARGEQL